MYINYKPDFAIESKFHKLKDIHQIPDYDVDEKIISSQLFLDSMLDIMDSFELDDEDIINDSVLHFSGLLKEKKFIDDSFHDYECLRVMLLTFSNFDPSCKISQSALELTAYLSSSIHFHQTEIMKNEQFFRWILVAATNFHNFNAFIILHNFSTDSRDNSIQIYSYYNPEDIYQLFIQQQHLNVNNMHLSQQLNNNVGYEDEIHNENKLENQMNGGTFQEGLLLLLSSYCHFDLGSFYCENIMTCIRMCLLYYIENEIHLNFKLLNELFYSLYLIQRNYENYISIASKIDIFFCFENLQCELPVQTIVTIFQYYADLMHLLKNESLTNDENEKPRILNIKKLMNYSSNEEDIISQFSLWLIWIYLKYDLSQINEIFNSDFLHILHKNISDGSFEVSKLAFLIYSEMVLCIDSSNLEMLSNDDIIDLIFDKILCDDEELIVYLIKILDKFLNYYEFIGNYDFYDFIKSKANDIQLFHLSKESYNMLNVEYNRIFSCFHE
ncbi:hypothetical protein TRFO_11354 [Tritrichomonas foetus]|uniref:Uncharacterized protein n=1 Tax=Tritrichomonas foetus TaxID=1144522 RepID=A0A1J4J3U0_9EUKA|nr:hypothetical protein TRFO_11354 [Tritrichomonas foetus]|eukprot:OHS94094.1 hypothetical protein TRFO_11354 [Tritrichomonas foetus]